MNGRRWLLASGLVGSALLAVFGDRTPVATQAAIDVVKPTSRSDSVTRIEAIRSASSTSSSPASSPVLLDIVDRSALIGQRPGEPSPTLFASRSWNPPPPVVPVQTVESVAPSPPPMPFVYLGRQFRAGRWEVFVSEGDATLILHESQLIDSRYRVDSIAPPIMTLTYLPLNTPTSLSIE